MIEKGMTNEELEKALQEEEANIANQEKNEAVEEIASPETAEENNETITEAKIEELTESLEAKAESVEKDLEEVGGEEGVKNTLDAMTDEKKKEIADKLEKLNNQIRYTKNSAKDEFEMTIPFSTIRYADGLLEGTTHALINLTGTFQFIGVSLGTAELIKLFKLKRERRALIKEQNKLHAA